ncbi:uncharacterized protein LOC122512855 [Leptopilina heterotoma]|uniref:uncharacterized protein LOC122512855 n=1 Tax=Leptopilina heterotoma TaxID=63436 RepID=UPI001CA994B3|nr:uncharacterized protein LOC122512855 [Leptopilina heterotoma]
MKMSSLHSYQYSSNFQFLSVCQYITTLGIYFYNKNLIPLEKENQTITIINTFFKYIDQSENESVTKHELLRILLRGTDLYGGGENEILDMKYVNETYQRIISLILFSHYGDIHNYLAAIISRADNVTYYSLKETIFEHLSKNYTYKNYCSSDFVKDHLTELSIKKIFYDYIWPIFPQPQQDISIMDVNYLYAMIGLKVVRSITVNVNHFSFDTYVTIVREMIFNSIEINETNLIQDLFYAPALFFYAYKEKETFNYQMIDDTLLKEIYHTFFLHINNSVLKVIDDNFKQTLYSKLENEMKKLNSRTYIAFELLLKNCRYRNFGEISMIHVAIYKTCYHWLTKLIFFNKCDNLPELEEVYRQQFHEAGNVYNQIEKLSLERILINSKLMDVMNSEDVVVKLARPADYPQRCNLCSRVAQKMNEDIYLLFAVIKNDLTEFYALKQENSSLVLLKRSLEERKFYLQLGVNSALKVETAQFFDVLKRKNEGASAFVERVAEMKTKRFLREIYNHYHKPTGVEKFFNFLKMLIPFYSCVESIQHGETGNAVWSCSLDVISLIPLGTFAGKYVTIFKNSIITELSELQIVSKALSKLRASNSLPEAFAILSRSVMKTLINEIFTNSFIKDFTLAILKSVDPGFELTYQFTRFSLQMLTKAILKFRNTPRRAVEIANLHEQLDELLETLQRNLKTPNPDDTGLVPRIIEREEVYQVLLYFYPGGSYFFGPTCIRSFGRVAELRTIEGRLEQIPVVPQKTSEGLRYRKYIPESGQITDEEFRVQSNGLLQDDNEYVMLSPLETSESRPLQKSITNLLIEQEWRTVENTGPLDTIPFRNRDNAANYFTNEQENVLIPNRFNYFSSVTPISFQAPSSVLRVDYLSKIGPERYDFYVQLLTEFRDYGLPTIRLKKQLFRELQLACDDIAHVQLSEVPLKSTIDLWHMEIISERHIIRYLKKLQGKQFYFNDIQLVTSDIIGSVKPKPRTLSFDTIVYYRLKVDQQYGIIDLNNFNDNFRNLYVIYPDVQFTVTNIIYPETKNVIILEMDKNPLTMETWRRIQMKELKKLMRLDFTQTNRLKAIDDAAELLSSNTPLCKLSIVKYKFQDYILKLQASTSPVPTYEKLVTDIHENLIIPEIYQKYKINRGPHIDDILFQTKLEKISHGDDAIMKIKNLFQGIYKQNVLSVFHYYNTLANIRNTIRFEDYYILYSFLEKSLIVDKFTERRLLASTYRLALRQCDGESIGNAIKLYRLRSFTDDNYMIVQSFKKGKILQYGRVKEFSSNLNNERESFLTNSKIKVNNPVLYQLELKNQAGIANIDEIISRNLYLVPPTSRFIVDKVGVDVIDGRDVLVVKMHDEEVPTEERMVNIVESLNTIFESSNVKLYVD